ncbi:MAG: lipoprotein-releasing ABC transporter permease subunit [Deltaproteobacteria bacterium]|nr:lipoprotein-releasing ABC transporter permease subunit [Deltaproteobacteria bacterium]MBW2649877.1 lipoprotein-releasing ABC transporter permease subunit [Deltaproteobacteria bacterium]
MSYEFFISLRYLRAKRKQAFISANTFISMAGIFLGVAALIIVLSVMNGFEIELRNKILGINSHIVLMEYSGGMKDYGRVMEELKSVDGVVATTPFIYGQAMLKNEGRATGVVLRGISTETSADVINLGKMKEGDIDYLSGRGNDTGLPGVVIGKELAQNLGLLLFDTVEILLPMGIPTPMGVVPKIKKFSVVAIFDSGSYEYDSSLAFVSLEDGKKFLNMKDEVTGIEIKVNDILGADRIAKAIEEKLGYPYWARSWMKMNKNLFSALKLERRVMFIILSLIVLVAAFNIITTLIMTVMEKARDIAILKAMGATARGIMKIFMIEGIVIGAIGTALGCITGITVALNLEWISRSVEDLFSFKILPEGIYYLNEIPSQINYGDVVAIVLVAMLISFLAAIYPSWRASRLDPAEALRYE